MEMDQLLAAMLKAQSAPKPGFGPSAHNVHKPIIDPKLPADKQQELHSAYVGQLCDHMSQLDESEKQLVKAECQRILAQEGFNS
jgi:hypothetical protein